MGFLEDELTALKIKTKFYSTSLSRSIGLDQLVKNVSSPTKGGYIWPGNTVLNRDLIRYKFISIRNKIIENAPQTRD